MQTPKKHKHLGKLLITLGVATLIAIVTNASTFAATTIGSNISTDGNASVTGTLGVTGISTLGTVNATTVNASTSLNTIGSGTLTVAGEATLNSNATITGTLGVTGISTLGTVNATTVNASTSLNTTGSGTLTVAGEATFNGSATFNGRLIEKQGVAVASANNLTLGSDGNVFNVTGTTTINGIDTTSWTAGSHVTLVFSDALTVKNNWGVVQAPIQEILLSGGTDLTTASNTVLGLVYDGSVWQETFRKTAASASSGWGAGTDSNDIQNTNSGNVGIGTAAPAAKLEVNGTSQFDSTATFTTINASTSINTTGSGTLTVAGVTTLNGNVRIGGSRVIQTNKTGTIPPATSNGTETCKAGVAGSPTATEALDSGIFFCYGGLFNMPTVQGTTGLVSLLPGAAVGDIFSFLIVTTTQSLISTTATGLTFSGSTTLAANTTRQIWCRVTGITAGSETVTCY